MPGALTHSIGELSHYLMCAVETTYDQEVTLLSTDVMATMGLSGKIMEGQTEDVKFDGSDGVDIPQISRNLTNGFEFEFYGAASGTLGVKPIADKIFRICGAQRFYDGQSAGVTVAMPPSDNALPIVEEAPVLLPIHYSAASSNFASGTFVMFEEADEGVFKRYLTTGARGQLGFGFDDGGKAKWMVSNLIGTYYEPTELNAAAVATPNYGSQKTRLPLDVDFANTAELSFGGHQLCTSSMSVDNVFGFEAKRVNLPGCRRTHLSRITPIINLTFRMNQWNATFNPYKKASTANGVTRLPFVFELGATAGNIFSLIGAGNNETQITQIKPTNLSDGTKGMQVSLRCLSGLELIFK